MWHGHLACEKQAGSLFYFLSLDSGYQKDVKNDI